MRNQYFRLEFRDTTACLHIYPPEEGGQMLTISEVVEYLASKKLDQYDLKTLNAAVTHRFKSKITSKLRIKLDIICPMVCLLVPDTSVTFLATATIQNPKEITIAMIAIAQNRLVIA